MAWTRMPAPQLCFTMGATRLYGARRGYTTVTSRLFPPPQAKVVPNNDKDRTYAVSYVPKVAGLHKVSPHEALAAWTPFSAHTPPQGTSRPLPTLLGSALP